MLVPDGYISTVELAERYGVSRSSVAHWISNGLPALKVGTKNYVKPEDVEPWRAQREAYLAAALQKRIDETEARRARRAEQAKTEQKRRGRKKKGSKQAAEEEKQPLTIKEAYIVGMDFDLLWDKDDVKKFIVHYANLRKIGTGPKETVEILAAKFNRHRSDVAVLILDLGDKGKISPDGSYDLILGWR